MQKEPATDNLPVAGSREGGLCLGYFANVSVYSPTS